MSGCFEKLEDGPRNRCAPKVMASAGHKGGLSLAAGRSSWGYAPLGRPPPHSDGNLPILYIAYRVMLDSYMAIESF